MALNSFFCSWVVLLYSFFLHGSFINWAVNWSVIGRHDSPQLHTLLLLHLYRGAVVSSRGQDITARGETGKNKEKWKAASDGTRPDSKQWPRYSAYPGKHADSLSLHPIYTSAMAINIPAALAISDTTLSNSFRSITVPSVLLYDQQTALCTKSAYG